MIVPQNILQQKTKNELTSSPIILIIDNQRWDPIGDEKRTLTDEEWVASFVGTLIGRLDGKYFACPLDLKIMKAISDNPLFFQENEIHSKLKSSPSMSVNRTLRFLDKICPLLKETGWEDEWKKMQEVRKEWENIPEVKQQIERILKIEENRRKTAENKAQKEADRIAKKEADEKAKQERLAKVEADHQSALLAKQQKEQEEKHQAIVVDENVSTTVVAVQTAQQAEINHVDAKKTDLKKLIQSLDKQTDIPPVFDLTPDGYSSFYGKIDGNLMHVIVRPSRPRCQVLTPTKARPMTPQEMVTLMDSIETHLNQDETFDTTLDKFGELYEAFEAKGKPVIAPVQLKSVYPEIAEKLLSARTMIASASKEQIEVPQKTR